MDNIPIQIGQSGNRKCTTGARAVKKRVELLLSRKLFTEDVQNVVWKCWRHFGPRWRIMLMFGS